MKEKLKQFLCGLTGHRKSSASVNKEGRSSYHLYCADCKKTLMLSFSSNLNETEMDFLLRKI